MEEILAKARDRPDSVEGELVEEIDSDDETSSDTSETEIIAKPANQAFNTEPKGSSDEDSSSGEGEGAEEGFTFITKDQEAKIIQQQLIASDLIVDIAGKSEVEDEEKESNKAEVILKSALDPQEDVLAQGVPVDDLEIGEKVKKFEGEGDGGLLESVPSPVTAPVDLIGEGEFALVKEPSVVPVEPVEPASTLNAIDDEVDPHEDSSAPSSLESQGQVGPSSVIVESQEVPIPDQASFIIKTTESNPLEGLPTPQEPVVEVIPSDDFRESSQSPILEESEEMSESEAASSAKENGSNSVISPAVDEPVMLNNNVEKVSLNGVENGTCGEVSDDKAVQDEEPIVNLQTPPDSEEQPHVFQAHVEDEIAQEYSVVQQSVEEKHEVESSEKGPNVDEPETTELVEPEPLKQMEDECTADNTSVENVVSTAEESQKEIETPEPAFMAEVQEPVPVDESKNEEPIKEPVEEHIVETTKEPAEEKPVHDQDSASEPNLVQEPNFVQEDNNLVQEPILVQEANLVQEPAFEEPPAVVEPMVTIEVSAPIPSDAGSENEEMIDEPKQDVVQSEATSDLMRDAEPAIVEPKPDVCSDFVEKVETEEKVLDEPPADSELVTKDLSNEQEIQAVEPNLVEQELPEKESEKDVCSAPQDLILREEVPRMYEHVNEPVKVEEEKEEVQKVKNTVEDSIKEQEVLSIEEPKIESNEEIKESVKDEQPPASSDVEIMEEKVEDIKPVPPTEVEIQTEEVKEQTKEEPEPTPLQPEDQKIEEEVKTEPEVQEQVEKPVDETPVLPVVPSVPVPADEPKVEEAKTKEVKKPIKKDVTAPKTAASAPKKPTASSTTGATRKPIAGTTRAPLGTARSSGPAAKTAPTKTSATATRTTLASKTAASAGAKRPGSGTSSSAGSRPSSSTAAPKTAGVPKAATSTVGATRKPAARPLPPTKGPSKPAEVTGTRKPITSRPTAGAAAPRVPLASRTTDKKTVAGTTAAGRPTAGRTASPKPTAAKTTAATSAAAKPRVPLASRTTTAPKPSTTSTSTARKPLSSTSTVAPRPKPATSTSTASSRLTSRTTAATTTTRTSSTSRANGVATARAAAAARTATNAATARRGLPSGPKPTDLTKKRIPAASKDTKTTTSRATTAARPSGSKPGSPAPKPGSPKKETVASTLKPDEEEKKDESVVLNGDEPVNGGLVPPQPSTAGDSASASPTEAGSPVSEVPSSTAMAPPSQVSVNGEA